MSSKHLFIEQWTPRPAWIARTPAERRAFADAVLGAIEAMKAGGIRTLGWGAADRGVDHADPAAAFWAVWEMDSAEAVAGFRQGVEASGWYTLFEQHNTTGVAQTPAQVLELLAGLPS
ncbi:MULTISPECIES: DUF6616 family protein [Variovorax]|uniref:DUF6616 family protein n=1 Tax=Variovorax TaxID=34072 RepID=UPI0008DFAE78|nr:DUF6616 family protein [Variovorax sp. PDC80]SFO06555.1 hypothetical protein SAMN05443579_101540 [Variovorax sp. PDC80]